MFERALDEFVLYVLLVSEREALSNDVPVLCVNVERLCGGSFPVLQLASHGRPIVNTRRPELPTSSAGGVGTHQQGRAHVLCIYRLSKLFHCFLYPSHPCAYALGQFLRRAIIEIEAETVDDGAHLACPVCPLPPPFDDPPIDALHDAREVMRKLVGKRFRIHEPAVRVFQRCGRADVGQEVMRDV